MMIWRRKITVMFMANEKERRQQKQRARDITDTVNTTLTEVSPG